MVAVRMLSVSDAEKVARRNHIDLWHQPVTLDEFCAGLNTEIQRSPEVALTDRRCAEIAHTVLEHLRKEPHYYDRFASGGHEQRDHPSEFDPLGDRPDW